MLISDVVVGNGGGGDVVGSLLSSITAWLCWQWLALERQTNSVVFSQHIVIIAGVSCVQVQGTHGGMLCI